METSRVFPGRKPFGYRLPGVWAVVFLMAVWGLAPLSAEGAERNILVVLSDLSRPYLEVVDGLRGQLDRDNGAALGIVSVPDFSAAQLQTKPPDLIVAVGVRAMLAATAANPRIPTLVLLVPRQSFDSVARARSLSDPRIFSAIYLDQPYLRQLQLIKYALPGRSRVGLLVGDMTAGELKPLGIIARQLGLTLVIRQAGPGSNLIGDLNELLGQCDVLLALPDPRIFNENTVQGVLLTAYRHGVPLVGFSRAYVKAGAIAAVYSTPPQIGEEAGSVIRALPAGRAISLPPPAYPKDFSVEINEQVAHSLGIEVTDIKLLAEQLRQAVGPGS